ncbi:Vacuolar import and degradation protein 27 [Hanseniaspora osmophila]|mgnify:CR=1 FL=1|uniref:Vacuolar import and degradation protein 27 n=1 Tax=Hanseniaspora osmophila TaxID=56408 RepID=A0A1E5RPM4_9ASCO|nr:Vacuolar import and degradation protein 27 [Hanseniaspora osmophila]
MEGLISSSVDDLSNDNCILKVIVNDSGKKLCVELPDAKRSLEFPVNSNFVLNFDMNNVLVFWTHRGIEYFIYPLRSDDAEFRETYDYFSSIIPCEEIFDQKKEDEEEEEEKEEEEVELTLSDIPALQAKPKNLAQKSLEKNEAAAEKLDFESKLKNLVNPSLKKKTPTVKSEQATLKNNENVDDLLFDVNKKMTALSLKSEATFENVQISVYDTVREKEFVQAKNGSVAFHFSKQSDTWLQLLNKKHESLANTDCNTDIDPEFDIFSLTFKFKYFLEEKVKITYIVTFHNLLQYTKFKAAYLGYQEANRTGNSPAQVSRNFGSFFNRSQEEHSDDSESEYEEASDEADQTSAIIDSFYRPGSTTRSLTVGLNSNRSYVVHDNNISVIKEDVINDELEYISTFKNVSYHDSKPFVPSNPMMYLQDQALIFQNENAPTNLYKMDLNKGVVVEEWSMGDNPVVNYSPAKKFDQLNLEQTFMGISKKSVFKVDPRISSKSKIVQDSNFEYKTNPNFSSIATSQSGLVSLGSKNGSVRLFDKLGGRAKTLINGFGDTIKHVVVSNDGRWLLATCSQNIILYDLLIAEGKPNAGVTGFRKSNSDPNFYFLTVPESFEEEQEDVSTKTPVEFSKAYFNTGIEVKETTIVSSYGFYVLSWKLSNILKGHLEPVVLKKFADNKVRENNFIFGSNDKVVIALNKGVTLASRK